MLHEVFYWLVNMSISASLCGLILLLLRKLKIPRRIFAFLWLIPFIRMTVPFGVRGKLTLMELTARLHSKEITLPELDGDFISTFNHVGFADSYFPVDYRTEALRDVFEIGALVWLVGAAALVIAFFIIYFTTLDELKGATPIGNGVFVSPKVSSPALYGILKPRIIVPSEADTSDLILLHENTHAKRGDNIWRFLAFVCAAIHWFNPLAWLFLGKFLEDIELACDEAVLAACGKDRRREYALLLVEQAEKKSVFASAFGGAKLKIRAKNILSYKKMTAASCAAFILLTVSVFYVLLAN